MLRGSCPSRRTSLSTTLVVILSTVVVGRTALAAERRQPPGPDSPIEPASRPTASSSMSDEEIHFIRWIHWWKGSYFDRLPASAGLPAGGNRDSDYLTASTEMKF